MKLAELIEVIGPGAVESLAKEYGGITLHVPCVEALAPHHPLVELLGYDNAARLSTRARGDQLEVPKFDAWRLAARNDLIRADRIAGASQAALARKYGLTKRWVRTILNRTA